jgi:hypothetical protein
MKRAESWVFGGLLLVTLGLAYRTWKHEEPAAKSSVVVFDPGPNGVTALVWQDDKSIATVEVQGTGDEMETWVVAGRRPNAPKDGDDDDSAKEETPAPPPGEPDLRRFPGNDQARDLAKSFAPLRALREFDKLDDESKKEMGLDKPEGTLTVKSAAGEMTFEIAGKAYGSTDTYLRKPGSEVVWLVASKDLGPLRGADTRLMERDVFGFGADEIVSVTLRDGTGREARGAQQGRHDKSNAFWTQPDKPEERDTVLGGLVEKVLQLRATSYPVDSEKPADGTVEVQLTASFVGESGELGKLELGRREDAKRSKPDEPAWEWLVRTTRTRDGWAVVAKGTAQDAVDALSSLLTR